jgi:deoxyribose-phosphate aldolase
MKNKYEEALSKFVLDDQDEIVRRKTAEILEKAGDNHTQQVLRFLYSCIDLTSLETSDSKESVWKWIEAVNDFEGSRSDVPKNVAAVCVYPSMVETVYDALRAEVKIAAVAAGFPSSQTFLEVKTAEVSLCVAEGAQEIDVVINCGALLDNEIDAVVEELSELKHACRQSTLKVILETGLLKTTERIKTAAALAMFAGADFVKTSTGKVYPGASPEAVYTMCQVAREYNKIYHRKVGIKVSGGVRTTEQAVQYFTIVKSVLGTKWLTPELFRIGASSLADNLLREIDQPSK